MLMERDDAREQLLVRQREAAISLCFTVESLLALGPKFTIVSCKIALNQTNPLSVWDVFFNHRCQNHRCVIVCNVGYVWSCWFNHGRAPAPSNNVWDPKPSCGTACAVRPWSLFFPSRDYFLIRTIWWFQYISVRFWCSTRGGML